MNFILLFFLFTFIGWVWECIFESIRHRKVINRGFLNGPCIPLYGLGGLATYFVFTIHVTDTSWQTNTMIFFVGMVGATVLEYATAIILETLFETTWWDYNDFPLNYKGRICLIASLFWGAAVLMFSQVINPYFLAKIDAIPHDWKLGLSVCFSTIFVLDFISTIIELIDLKVKLQLIANHGVDKVDALFMKISPIPKRLIHAFPQLKFKSPLLQRTFMSLKERSVAMKDIIMKKTS